MVSCLTGQFLGIALRHWILCRARILPSSLCQPAILPACHPHLLAALLQKGLLLERAVQFLMDPKQRSLVSSLWLSFFFFLSLILSGGDRECVMVEFSEDTRAQMQGCWRASEPSVCGDGSGCRQGLMEHDSLIPSLSLLFCNQ